MQRDLKINQSSNKQRTVRDFSSAMFKLLEHQSFEKITVQEICTESHYPRSTFYNYFNDKFDLMNQCWNEQIVKLNFDDGKRVLASQIIELFFSRAYDLVQENRDDIRLIMQHNDINDQLWTSFRSSINNILNAIFLQCEQVTESKLPADMLSEYLSSTCLLVLKKCFFSKKVVPLEEAQRYLKQIINDSIFD